MLHLVINLDRSKERWTSVYGQLKELGIEPERLSAVDGSKFTQEEFDKCNVRLDSKEKIFFPRDLTRGEIGCFLSHRKAWKRLIDSDEEWAVIIEDDVLFSKRALSYLNSDKWIPEGADIVQLHLPYPPLQVAKVRRTGVRLEDGTMLWRAVRPNPLGTQCYIISKKCANEAYQASKNLTMPVDVFLFAFLNDFSRKHIIYTMNPAVVRQWESEFGSEIAGDREKTSFRKNLRTRLNLRKNMLRIRYNAVSLMLCKKETFEFK